MEHFDWIKGALFPYINFFIFLFLAVKFLRKPMAAFAKSRHEKFLSMVAQAKAAKESAEAMRRELAAEIERLDTTLARRLQEAKDGVAQESRVALKETQEIAKHVIEEAHRTIAAEVTSMKKNLADEITALALSKATEAIRARLDEKMASAFLRKRLDELSKEVQRADGKRLAL